MTTSMKWLACWVLVTGASFELNRAALSQSAPHSEIEIERQEAEAPAGGSRAEIWKQRRLAKAASAKPSNPSKLEKVLLQLESSRFLEVNYKNFFPKLSSISTGSGFAPGVRYWRPDINKSRLDFQASGAYSIRGYQQYDIQFGKILQKGPQPFLQTGGEAGLSQFGEGTRQEKFFLYADIKYRYFPQEDFFGLGPDSREEDRSDFVLEDFSIGAVTGYRFNRWLSTAFEADLLDVDTSEGTDERFPATQDLFDEANVPGLRSQPDYVRLSSGFFVDYRDKTGNPHQGGLLSFSIARFLQRRGNDLQFTRYAFDARHYIPLGSPQRVLAIRAFTSLDDADRNSQVPFYLQNTLGSDALRSFRDFRFRDSNLLYMSAEYRWEAAPALEFALFYDTGKVFSDRSNLNFQGLEKTYGAGVRFKTLERVIIRIDVGRGPEGTRLHLQFGPSF